jgi:hypothetical protein
MNSLQSFELIDENNDFNSSRLALESTLALYFLPFSTTIISTYAIFSPFLNTILVLLYHEKKNLSVIIKKN